MKIHALLNNRIIAMQRHFIQRHFIRKYISSPLQRCKIRRAKLTRSLLPLSKWTYVSLIIQLHSKIDSKLFLKNVGQQFILYILIGFFVPKPNLVLVSFNFSISSWWTRMIVFPAILIFSEIIYKLNAFSWRYFFFIPLQLIHRPLFSLKQQCVERCVKRHSRNRSDGCKAATIKHFKNKNVN